MKWNFKELYNQFLHIETGVFFTYWSIIIPKRFFNYEFFDYRLLLVGFTVGFTVEIYQYFFKDKKQLHLPDRIRDNTSYIIGSAMVWLI